MALQNWSAASSSSIGSSKMLVVAKVVSVSPARVTGVVTVVAVDSAAVVTRPSVVWAKT